MDIIEGGATSRLTASKKIESIRISAVKGNDRIFEMWINHDCLSYLSITELLSLKDEIQIELERSIR